jgi:glycosyltransferase involved in cell wall biosynthesis
MPALLRQFDVLLVPSVWQEPLARMVLEGMAAGLVVIATPTGGTAEVIEDGNNGLFFTPGDGEDLARKIDSLADDPEILPRLAYAGRQTVTERFTATRMMDDIENYLRTVATNSLVG